MKPYHRVSKLEDVVSLAPNLRYEDVREVETLGRTPEQSLLNGYMYGKMCRSIIDKYGHVVGMCGVVPTDDKTGLIWMLGSKGLKKINYITVLKENRILIEKMNKIWPHLWNIIDSRNEVHLKWLKWCGFTIIGERMINKVKFYEFTRIA